MKTFPSLRWACLWLALVLGPTLRAALVAPPVFTYIGLPATVELNQSGTITATGQASYSDNSDGNDWNAPDRLRILRVMVYVLPPGGSWTLINDWMPTWVSPNTATLNYNFNQLGTWYFRFGLMDGRPWFASSIDYSVEVTSHPAPAITSALSVSANQGQTVSYQIVAANSPTGFGASNLPPGLSFNAASGVISGRLTGAGTVNATIGATNAVGTDTKTLVWWIAPAVISGAGAVSPPVNQDGQTVSLTRAGSANFGVAWFETVIWRPNGTFAVLPNSGAGTITYAPDGGPGAYIMQLRIVDNYYNFIDQYVAFYLGNIAPLTVTNTNTGQTFDALTTSPTMVFGQTITASATVSDPSGTMIYSMYAGDMGVAGNWVGYGGNNVFSARGSYNLTTTYQPTGVGTGAHWMAAFGYSSAGTGGWWGRGYNVLVGKAAPAGTYAALTRTPAASGYYTVAAGDLAASFANPYSAAVSAPTGASAYTLGGGAVSVGATQVPTGTRTIQAAYPGDANYLPATVSATLTVLGPTMPGALGGAPSSIAVSLSWTASAPTAGQAIAQYHIYRNGVLLGTAAANATGYTDSTATPSTTYAYTVRAVDAGGNLSTPSNVNATTLASFELFTPAP